MLKILSLGAGVQSSTVALMMEHGEIDKPDYAIFADTGWEPKKCYDWLDWLESQLSFPVIRVSKGNIRDDLIKTLNSEKLYSKIPFFTKDGGMGNRQCTSDYKIAPIHKKCRELLGYKPKQRVVGLQIEMFVGISLDEHMRMKPSRDKWIVNRWPLIELRMTRQDCLDWMSKHNYPVPPKSSCIGCPYHHNEMWRDIRDNDFAAWMDACYVDSLLVSKNLGYMHRSLLPLADAPIDAPDKKNTFVNECEGICGV